MAPRKTTTAEPSTRVTRSSTRRPLKPIAAASPPKKRAKKAAAPKEKSPTPQEEESPVVIDEPTVVIDEPTVAKKKTIVVEYCKQCTQFKIRALKVKEGLEKGLSGTLEVVLNPEKPRRGCFEIREDGEGGEKFVTLLDMKRPFAPMKALDMEEVISDIVAKIKA